MQTGGIEIYALMSTNNQCILHKYSCVLTDVLYEFVYLILRYTTGVALLKIIEQLHKLINKTI